MGVENVSSEEFVEDDSGDGQQSSSSDFDEDEVSQVTLPSQLALVSRLTTKLEPYIMIRDAGNRLV